jgi:predicted amidohydrolase YtcJ
MTTSDGRAVATGAPDPADTLITNGRIATMSRRRPFVSALAIRGDRIIATGSEGDLARLRGPDTVVIDAQGRTVIPGLNDSHTHFIRGGLTYSMEVRWDGLASLAEGLRMLREQARRTPAPHWVQVIGGWTWAQFAEKRYPTLDEINAATGQTPAMVMHLYDRAWLNRAALRVLGWTRDTPDMFGGTIERDASGHPTGVVMATSSLASLVGVWLSIPRLSPDEQTISTRHFMREHNRLGVTSLVDAGGGGQNYPDNYQSIAGLAREKLLTLRIGYTLFAQTPGKEIEDYRNWSGLVQLGQGDDYFRMIGAGEYLTWSAGDSTNFNKDFAGQPVIMESQFTEVVKYVAGMRWPFRQHTTWDSSAQRILGVLENVNREVPLTGLKWGLDHCEVIGPKTLERIAALGGSINIQNRLSTDGEAFLARQGATVAADAPPIARIREMGIPLAAGTDANRAVSYNPWIGVHWLITGETLGGAKLNADRNLLDRAEALRLYTAAGAWISDEEERKGTLEEGKLADIVFLSADYFNIPVEAIKDLESVMTMVGGKVVYGSGIYERLAPPAPPINHDWLPIKSYGGYQKRTRAGGAIAMAGMGHEHPRIVGDRGTWSLDCPCGT